MAETQMPSPEYLAEDCGYILVNVAIAFTVLETFFVALRFYSRHLARASFGLDDYLIIPALFLCYAVNGVVISMVKYADVGRHITAVGIEDPEKIVVWLKFLIVIPCVYLAAVVLPKIVILLIYLRIFTQKPYRIACYVLGVIIIISAIITIFLAIFECIPIAYLWDKTIPGGHCINTNAYFLWASFPNILTDAFMLVLPLPIVWKLQTTNHIKVGLTLTFMTGSIGLLTSILRFYYFSRVDAFVDGTWTSVNLLTWTTIEPGVYLIAACLPTLRPLAMFVWRRDTHTGGKAGTGGSQSTKSSRLPRGTGYALTKDKGTTYSVDISGQDPAHNYIELDERRLLEEETNNRRVMIQTEYGVSTHSSQ